MVHTHPQPTFYPLAHTPDLPRQGVEQTEQTNMSSHTQNEKELTVTGGGGGRESENREFYI